MSIRYMILGPIALLSLVGVVAAAWTSLTSIRINSETFSNYETVQLELDVVERMIQRVNALETYQNHILSFNEVHAPDVIRNRFEGHVWALRRQFEELDAFPENDAVTPHIRALEAAADAWIADVAVAVGVTPAARIPTRSRLSGRLADVRLHAGRLRDQMITSSATFRTDARETLVTSTIGALSVIILVLAIASLLVMGRGAWLARSLTSLAQAMEQIKAGRFDVDVRDQNRTDEIGEIARGVADFSAALKKLTDAHTHIEHLALHDDLTGLANRVRLQDMMDRLFDRPIGEAPHFAVLHIDLDRFKEVNDTHGHAAGDAVLQMTAKVLTGVTEDGGLAARVGGDEFVVLLDKCGSERAASAVAQKIIDDVSRPVDFGEERLQVGASVGIAFAASASGSDKLLANADIALYLAKNGGRGRHCFYSPETGKEFARRSELARDLRGALENGEVIAFYQPQIDGVSGDLIGVEALVRWRHPTRGLLTPYHFLELAAENGLGDRLTEVVMFDAIEALRDWRAAGLAVPAVSLNFAARQLRSQDLIQKLEFAVEMAGLEPGDVAIEIVESVLFGDNADEELSNIRALQAKGFRLELDDFGTGYASISNLRKVQVSRIKIDGSFVTGLVDDKEQERLLKAIIDLCGTLGIECLAEGVETEAERSRLVSLGCKLLQGYGIAKPMDAEAFRHWMIDYVETGRRPALRA